LDRIRIPPLKSQRQEEDKQTFTQPPDECGDGDNSQVTLNARGQIGVNPIHKFSEKYHETKSLFLPERGHHLHGINSKPRKPPDCPKGRFLSAAMNLCSRYSPGSRRHL
jgi:hypothetical protein